MNSFVPASTRFVAYGSESAGTTLHGAGCKATNRSSPVHPRERAQAANCMPDCTQDQRRQSSAALTGYKPGGCAVGFS